MTGFSRPLFAQQNPPQIIEQVTPASATASASQLSVRLTLKDMGTPPIPPSDVTITSFQIGTITGHSITRNGRIITAIFDIPASEPSGDKTITLSFPNPDNNTIQFSQNGLFTVSNGGDNDTGFNDHDNATGEASDGASLFSPQSGTTTYLLDKDEEIVKTWNSSYHPGLSCYLLDDGSLLRTGSLGPQGNRVFGTTGGAGGVIERYSWEGDLIWQFQYSSSDYLLHHDIEPLPNGNILMIAWERKTQSDAVTAGRDPSLLSDGELWPDKIIEVKPTGSSGGTIVWEWHVWDHLIQDYDASKSNYGTVSDHPEKINLNYVHGRESADWNHINGVDYNADLDQILLTEHNFSEIWIIDHNTTTAQAAGSVGDLLYRWGNPQAYGRGNSSDQQLFVPHDAQWIDDNCPGAGDILIFNNGQNRPEGNYSSVDQIIPHLNGDGSYTVDGTSAYGPASTTWTYKANPTSSFYADHISGAQRLTNGNTLICDGPAGRFFEVSSTGEITWEYVNPYSSSTPQGESNEVFRAQRYLLDDSTGNGNDNQDEYVSGDLTYPIVDTGQDRCYNDGWEISAPGKGDAFYGQDAQIDGYQPSYTVSGDGLTVYDTVTGLTWTRGADWNGDGTEDADDKFTYTEALSYVAVINAQNYGGYSDWRLPSIKELYSLIDYRGTDPNPTGTSTSGLVPFINDDVFEFAYGDMSAGERIIDSQWATTTLYTSTVMYGQQAMFGVNFADGRIKGYPADTNPGGFDKTFYVRFCRGNTGYGINSFVDNGNGTVTDNATGLMWSKSDNGAGVNWEDALAWVQQMNNANYLGYNDWRLPNAKELQSLVDYTRSPDTHGTAAIDPVFIASQITDEAGKADFPFYWSSTTFLSFIGGAERAVYVAFGEGLGSMDGTTVIDVHGAGCQRSDPKNGDPNDYPSWGHGPQGDVQRVFNYVRLVRDADSQTSAVLPGSDGTGTPGTFSLGQNYPNPFNPDTTIPFILTEAQDVSLTVYNIAGQKIRELASGFLDAGQHTVIWDATNDESRPIPSGIYLYRLAAGSESRVKKMIFVK